MGEFEETFHRKRTNKSTTSSRHFQFPLIFPTIYLHNYLLTNLSMKLLEMIRRGRNERPRILFEEYSVQITVYIILLPQQHWKATAYKTAL